MRWLLVIPAMASVPAAGTALAVPAALSLVVGLFAARPAELGKVLGAVLTFAAVRMPKDAAPEEAGAEEAAEGEAVSEKVSGPGDVDGSGSSPRARGKRPRSAQGRLRRTSRIARRPCGLDRLHPGGFTGDPRARARRGKR